MLDDNKIEICEKLIDLMRQGRLEIKGKGQGLPKIFYIGNARSGSTSLKYGFDEVTARWHSLKDFEEKVLKSNLLSKNNLHLYHVIDYMGSKYGFKPLIMECIRDPIGRFVSLRGRNLSSGNLTPVINEIKKRNIRLTFESLKWKDIFGVDLLKEFDNNKKYFYKELDNVKLLFFRYEEIKDREKFFESLGYKYTPSKMKSSDSSQYRKLISLVKFTPQELSKIYDDEIMRTCYTDDEIKSFKKKWS